MLPASSVPRPRNHLLQAPPAGGKADDAEGANEEGAEGDGHGPAQPLHLADLGLVGGHQDGSGAEEEGDFPEGMHGDVHSAADDSPFVGQQRPQHDVRKLADGGIGQAGLQVVFREGHGGKPG